MARRTWFLVAGCLLSAVGVILLAMSRTRDRAEVIVPTPPARSEAAKRELVTVPEQASEPREPQSPVVGSEDVSRAGDPEHALPTVEEVGREFWGARWEAIRPRLAERVPLTTRMDVALPPWREVQPLVCERMKLADGDIRSQRARYLPPEPITIGYLMDAYSISPNTWTDADVLALEMQLLETRADGQEALDEYRRLVDQALAARCANGQYDYCPIANVEAPHVPKPAVFVTSFAISGWVITCGVSASDLPDLADLQKRLGVIKARSASIIGEAIAAKRR